jgi:hypothetical protein
MVALFHSSFIDKSRNSFSSSKYPKVPINRTREIESGDRRIVSYLTLNVCPAYIQTMDKNDRASASSLILQTPHHDYLCHRRAIEPVVTDIFLIWRSKTGNLNLVQLEILGQGLELATMARGCTWRSFQSFLGRRRAQLVRTIRSDFITPGRFSTMLHFVS